MTEADWANLASAATNLKQAALELATLPDPIAVVKPGTKIAFEDTDWGDSAASVQHNVDQDPQGVRDLANSLAQHMTDLAAAANKHDAATAGTLINDLDGICESCHVKYWYPSQSKLIETIRKTSGEDPTT
jgi:cytochrome c556